MLRLVFDFLAGDDLSTNNPQSVDSLKNIVEDDYSELCRKRIKIDDATIDQSIQLSDGTANYIIISTDREITIKLNGSSDSLTLTPRKSGVKSIVYFSKGSFTSLSVSNNSGAECNIDVISANA